MIPDFSDLVTTALLGTDRRPLPADLLAGSDLSTARSATRLLDLAARHRAAVLAGTQLESCAAPPRAPEDDLPDAPVAAQELLAGLLTRPLTELVNAWMCEAVAYGVRAGPEHWPDLVGLAATRADYDRRLLGGALGQQGRWFLDQNPSWQRLAETVRRELASPPPGIPPGAVDTDPAGSAVPDDAEVRERPEAALAVAAPWPRRLAMAALRTVLSGQLGWRGPRYGAVVGARLAPGDTDLLQSAVAALPDEPAALAPGLRLVREALAAVEQSAAARAAIEQAFAPAAGVLGRRTPHPTIDEPNRGRP